MCQQKRTLISCSLIYIFITLCLKHDSGRGLTVTAATSLSYTSICQGCIFSSSSCHLSASLLSENVYEGLKGLKPGQVTSSGDPRAAALRHVKDM